MSWVRLDDNFAEHPKVIALSDAAFRSHVRSLCYAGRFLTDGVIPISVVATIANKRARRELVEAGLWHETLTGIAIHDFNAYNRTRAEVEAERKRKSDAGKRGAEVRWGYSSTNAGGMAGAIAERTGSSMPPAQTQAPPDSVNPTEPVGKIHELAPFQAAVRLYESIPEDARDDGTQRVVLGYATQLEPAVFDEIRDSLLRKLKNDGLFKNAGAYVNGALQKAARAA